MRKASFFLALLIALGVVLPGVLRAADEETLPAATVTPQDYRLRSDDVIDVTVLGQAELNKTLTILPDGTIHYPYLGKVKAAGLTVDQLRARILTGLEDLYNNLEVTVSVKSLRVDKISVLGAVKTPGAFELRRGMTVMNAIAMAGGLVQKPEQVRAALVREGAAQPIDLKRLLNDKDPALNVLLEPDDMLLLQEMETSRIHILGAVSKPGPYELPAGGGLLEALATAGGATDKAALSKAAVLRDDMKIPVNLRAIIAGTPDPNANLALRPGDIITIPENQTRIAVLGEVKTPGYITVPDGQDINVIGAISQAGGQTDKANLREAGIIRVVNGKPQVTPVDLEKLLKKGDIRQNVAVHPDDIIFIPEKRPKRKMNWGSIMSGLYAFGYLAAL